jgi:hypothetical protein
MTSRLDQRIEDLQRVGPESRLIADQAAVLGEIARDIPNHLERSRLLAIIAADTALFENYSTPDKCRTWLTAALRMWLRTNEGFVQEVGEAVFYRYIVLPFPSILQNENKRQNLINLILLNVHLQLWHGVICGIVFADPRRIDVRSVAHLLNFTAIPRSEVFYDAPGIHREGDLNARTLRGALVLGRMKSIHNWLSPKRGEPIWLHYDEANFDGPRLSGWRWEALREFFRGLYGPTMRCETCNCVLGTFDLDHIAPWKYGYPQTIINFRPLCKKHNLEKAAERGEDPFRIRILLPEDFHTRELEELHRLPPRWLNRIRSPHEKKDITGRDVGF